ncbi:MAG: beta strand repeat-containing protein [Janthinobacterium lividum]
MSTTNSTVTGTGASTIFVGSSVGLDALAATAIADPLIADGDVGFYGHLDGIVGTYEDGTEKTLLSTWSETGSGLVELNQDEPMAIMSVTIANTGSTALTLPVGTIVSSASGVQYQLVQMPRLVSGWSNSGTAGSYTIAAGASLTLYAQALVDGPSANLLANQISQVSTAAGVTVAGASVTASSLITAAPQWGAGTVTLTNTSSTSQIIYEGVVLQGTGGSYEIGIDSTVSGFVATDADSSSGYYLLKAGATITVPIGSVATITATTATGIVTQELAEDAAANSITSGNLPTGVTIVSSSAITTTGITIATAQDHVSYLGANTGYFTDASAALFTTDQGYVPTEADVDTYNDYVWTKLDLTNWEAYVDSARAFGVLNLAPMLSEFETVDFATAAATQYVRAAALYSGGIAFDMPSWFFLARESAYQLSIEDEIKWATQNGLRSSITLSPESGDDENFLADTEAVIAILRAAGALPTQFVVKDGGVTGTDVIYSTTDVNSLNNVAAWLSSLTLTPSSSESGLETRGTTSRPDDLMTGVQQSENITNAAAVLPFSVAQLFAETSTTTATVTVTVGNVALGTLTAATGHGSVSANGAVFTMTGTMAQLTAGLQALSYTAGTGALGSTTLTTTIVDSAGAITGSTAITVDNALTLSGIASALSSSGPIYTDPSLVLSAGTQTATLTATVTLSNASLGSFWNNAGSTISTDGSTLTISGSAATLQTFLRQLMFMSAPGASGSETVTVAISDGTQTTSASTVIAVSAATGLALDNVPLSYVSAPFVLDAPYQDILVADAGNTSLLLTATVTLPTGTATLVSPGVGTLSANGTIYTLNGTATQIQVALRALQLSVPASATSSTEALTLSIAGESATTTVKVVSTDTVYVGAVDSTDGTYASTTIAAPLLATGKVGLFDDYNGMTATTIAGTSSSLETTWSSASAGVYGYSEGSDVALQTITITNTGTTSITVPVGTLAATASGIQFQVVQYNGTNTAWSAGTTGDGTLGVYTIAAGASITVPVEALAQGYVGNVAANAITTLASGSIANASITASAASLLATEYAGGTITLTNTTSAYIIVYEGTVVSNTTGTYAIGNDPTAAYYSARTTDSSVGIYYIAPGGSTTVPIYGTDAQTASTASGVLSQITAQTTTATNTITSTALPTGITITSSSAITATGPTTAAQGATWGGWGADTGVLTQRGYGYFLQGLGFSPSEANTNLNLTTEFTSADLASWDAYVDTLRGYGIMNVAATVSTSSAVLDISSSNATAYLRSAALYGGGIDVDLPASYLLSLGATAIMAIADDFKWAAANGLRATLTLRAYSDTSFMENTKTLLTDLQTAGGLPSQVVVVGSSSTATPNNSELPNMVAQYVAGLSLTPSTSESGLSTTASTTVASIMTGVRTVEAATGLAAVAPYSIIQVFAESSSDTMKAIVALNTVGLGLLSTAGTGTVSADGSTVTITGTPSVIAAALKAIVFTPASGVTGTAVLDISIADTNGTIQGQTSIAVSNPSSPVSLSASALATGTGVTTITVSTLASEHDVLTASGGGTLTNGVFQISGTAAMDAAALAGLRVTPGTGVTAPSLQVTVSGAAISLVDTGSGADSITSAGGNSIQTGSGQTTVAAGLGDTISAGSGAVSASSKSNFTFLGGSSGYDTVTGGAGGGSFTAGTGGHSKLAAGTGTTILHAAGSNDTLLGGGSSTLYGASGDATIIRTVNGDVAIGADGSTIFGPTTGGGTIQAGAGSETVFGGAGSMTVAGGAGFLHAVMGSGGGVVDGGSGNTQVTAGSGSVSVVGGSGSGTVYGGTGSASVTEGTGKEVYNFTKGIATGGQLFASGFATAKDQIVLSGYGSGAAALLVQSQVPTSGYTGTILTLSDGASITISGVSHITISNVTSV